MIFLVTNKKISTRKLQEKLKIKSYETALRNRKKIEEILDGIMTYPKWMDHEKLMGLVDVRVIIKRKLKKLDAIEKRRSRLGEKGINEQG